MSEYPCDICKVRRVKCNKDLNGCDHCIRRDHCTYTHVRKKRGPRSKVDETVDIILNSGPTLLHHHSELSNIDSNSLNISSYGSSEDMHINQTNLNFSINIDNQSVLKFLSGNGNIRFNDSSNVTNLCTPTDRSTLTAFNSYNLVHSNVEFSQMTTSYITPSISITGQMYPNYVIDPNHYI